MHLICMLIRNGMQVIWVQICWIFVVLFTFPLQMFPAAIILERCWMPERHSGRKWAKNMIRTLLTTLAMAIAAGAYSSVDNLVAVLSALCRMLYKR